MKKFIAKVLGLALSVVLAITAVGCYKGDDQEEIDSSKTQLYVGLVPSGYGNSWLKTAIARFEAQYAEYEFEPGSGKKGAQVIIDDVSYGNLIASSLPTARYQVIYTSDVNYHDLISKGLIYDMTSVINQKFDDFDANGNAVSNSIADKYLSQEQKNSYVSDGKIYALPFVSSDIGISYDRDLFEEKGLFFLASDPDNDDYTALYDDVQGTKQYTLGKESKKPLSMGRDGIAGTYDDGLPATYEQFYFLMNELISMEMTPITWSGAYPSYLTQLLYGIWANNEGAENMLMNYTLRGTAKDLIRIENDGTITSLPQVEINDNNGYMLHSQIGKYQALDFLDNIIEILKTDTKGYDMAFKESVDHLASQDNFLKSVVRSENNSRTYQRIAMFHDGTYWENEAAATFVAMGDGYGKMDRKIGWMPIPHPTTEGAGGSVFIGGASTMMFMNANIKEKDKDIATKFVQFMNTRKSLVEFTQITSMIRPLDFTATESEKQEMSYFGRSIYEKFKSADNFNPMSDNSVYKRNYSSFSIISSNNWRTLSSALGNTDIPSNALKSTDAKTYFRGMQAHFTQQWWNSSVLGN